MAIGEELNELIKKSIGEADGARLAAAFDSFFLAKTGGTMGAAADIALNATSGTKIGTAVSQKLGFWSATPVIQQAASAQAAVTPSTSFDGADTVSKATVLAAVQAVEALVNRLRLDLVTTGIIKGAA